MKRSSLLAEDLAWVLSAATQVSSSHALFGFPGNTYLDRDNSSISFLIIFNFFHKLQSNTLEKFQCFPPKNNTIKQPLT